MGTGNGSQTLKPEEVMEHQKLYQWVDAFTSPIRWLLTCIAHYVWPDLTVAIMDDVVDISISEMAIRDSGPNASRAEYRKALDDRLSLLNDPPVKQILRTCWLLNGLEYRELLWDYAREKILQDARENNHA
jgi:hypothetical protein